MNRWMPDGSSGALTRAGGLSQLWIYLFFTWQEPLDFKWDSMSGQFYSRTKSGNVEMNAEAGLTHGGRAECNSRPQRHLSLIVNILLNPLLKLSRHAGDSLIS